MSISQLIHAKDGEKILHVVRRHWLAVTPRLALVFLFLVVPFFFVFPLFALRPYGGFVFLALLLLGIYLAVTTAVQWYYTMFVVTSSRVVDVFQSGLFDRMVTDANYDVIQDVAYRKRGIINMLFNIGTITIQTSGGSTTLEIRSVNAPEVVLTLLNDARHNIRKAETSDTRSKLAKKLSALDEADVSRIIRTVDAEKRKKAMDAFFTESETEE